jgi:hypothetical protein
MQRNHQKITDFSFDPAVCGVIDRPNIPLVILSPG